MTQNIIIPGIVNLSNTCYMGTSFQCIFNQDEFFINIYNEEIKMDEDRKQKYFEKNGFKLILLRMAKAKKENFPFVSLGTFVNSLEGGLLRWNKQTDIFECLYDFSEKGFFDSILYLICGKTNISLVVEGGLPRQPKEEIFHILHLSCLEYNEGMQVDDEPIVSLDLLLSNKFKTEELSEENKVNLDSEFQGLSTEQGKATMTTKIKELGPYLIIELKRNYYDTASNEHKKNNQRISFEETMDLKNYFEVPPAENVTYILVSVIMHRGQWNLGHFYSYQKRDNKYFECNDETVTEVTFDFIKNKSFGQSENEGWVGLIYISEAYLQNVIIPSGISNNLTDEMENQLELIETELTVNGFGSKKNPLAGEQFPIIKTLLGIREIDYQNDLDKLINPGLIGIRHFNKEIVAFNQYRKGKNLLEGETLNNLVPVKYLKKYTFHYVNNKEVKEYDEENVIEYKINKGQNTGMFLNSNNLEYDPSIRIALLDPITLVVEKIYKKEDDIYTLFKKECINLIPVIYSNITKSIEQDYIITFIGKNVYPILIQMNDDYSFIFREVRTLHQNKYNNIPKIVWIRDAFFNHITAFALNEFEQFKETEQKILMTLGLYENEPLNYQVKRKKDITDNDVPNTTGNNSHTPKKEKPKKDGDMSNFGSQKSIPISQSTMDDVNRASAGNIEDIIRERDNLQKQVDNYKLEEQKNQNEYNSLSEKYKELFEIKKAIEQKLGIPNLSWEELEKYINKTVSDELTKSGEKNAETLEKQRLKIKELEKSNRDLKLKSMVKQSELSVIVRVKTKGKGEKRKIIFYPEAEDKVDKEDFEEPLKEIRLKYVGVNGQSGYDKTFRFDIIYPAIFSQEQIYSDMEYLFNMAIDGHVLNTIFIGTSGSGKTYSLLFKVTKKAGVTIDTKTNGILLRLPIFLYSKFKEGIIQKLNLLIFQTGKSNYFSMLGDNPTNSMPEFVLNEKNLIPFYSSQSKKAGPSTAQTDAKGQKLFSEEYRINLLDNENPIDFPTFNENIQNLLKNSFKNRTVLSTGLIDVSTRATCIYKIEIKLAGYNKIIVINLVDSAGGEKDQQGQERQSQAIRAMIVELQKIISEAVLASKKNKTTSTMFQNLNYGMNKYISKYLLDENGKLNPIILFLTVSDDPQMQEFTKDNFEFCDNVKKV